MRTAKIRFKVKSNYGKQGRKIASGAAEIIKSAPEAVRESLYFIRGKMRTQAPKGRTGKVVQSLKVFYRGMDGRITTNHPPAFFTEEGTGVAGRWATQPYFIPRSSVRYPLSRGRYNPAPQDSFQPSGSAAVFDRPGGSFIGFMHPGITPQGWFRKSVERSDARVLSYFDAVMKRALRGGGKR